MTSAPAASAPASAPRLAAGEIPGWTTSVTGLTAASEYRDALDVDELANAVLRRHPPAEHALGAAPHRLLHLAMQVVAQVVACLRTDLRLGAERIAHPPRSHLGHEEVEEGLGHRVDDDEALGGDAALAVVDETRLGGGARGGRDVGVLQDDERVAPAELEHGLLELAPGLLRDAAPGAVAAGQRDAAHARVGDDGPDPLRPDEHGAEHTFGQARFPEDPLDLERAARHVRGMLQDPRIARDERRGGEAEDLPEGKVPRHDREHGTERVEADVAPACVGPAGLRGEELLGVLGVIVAAPGALLDLRLALRDRLSHLERHGAGVRGLLRAQHARRIP